MTLEAQGQKDDLRGAVEAILTITDSPISLVALATALEQPVNLVRDIVLALSAEYEESSRGFELREVGGGWRLYVRAEYDGRFRCSSLTKTRPS